MGSIAAVCQRCSTGLPPKEIKRTLALACYALPEVSALEVRQRTENKTKCTSSEAFFGKMPYTALLSSRGANIC